MMLGNEAYNKLRTLIANLPVDAQTKHDIISAALDWAETILQDIRKTFAEIDSPKR